ncbi:hypothetical protein CAPTEDRAFT_149404 [Capitella teleta]|uniref:Sec1 family domain-containing protein 1 n=1 Tax=Capitella teleta TaxID=283909 RepID=R7U537_CAPTE|nr:hypothetical protein CAPTEDRAFT_149404 [Capitella teleta]|eukprot:ELU01084.1 hypothetical protein CAPTEDRAFT_149404 [Capitella teleta]
MLNFNIPLTKTSLSEPQWKVLVYDHWGQDIISPLLSVRELRELGVTLHLLLDSDREPIQDVPAVYFVRPTDDNVKRICKDFHSQLYESYYMNFISAISRQKLEDLALAAIQTNSVTQVTKIFDQYLNFISLEDDMFCLRHHSDVADSSKESISYYSINRGDVKDTEIERMMDNIVESLFCVFVTLGQVPIIRCPRNNAAEMVAEKLDKKLRDNIRDTRNSLFAGENVQSGQFSFQRPLLVILDRNIDLATPFHHTWTYQALSHDVLQLKLNRVEIEEKVQVNAPGRAPVEKKKVRSYDLNPTDGFWEEHKGSPFPTVAEAVQEKLDAYKAQEDEVKRLKTAMGLEGEDDETISMVSDNTARLTSAVSSLPELLEMKRLIDMHTNVATALLEQIKARMLDLYFETEERLMSRTTLDKSILDIIRDPEAGTVEDKVRLFIINLICGPPVSDAEIDQYCSVLQDAGCNLSAIQYIRRWKTYSKLPMSSAYSGGGTKTVGMFSKLVSTASQFAMEGVKNLVVKKHNLPVTKVLDSLMDMKSSSETDDFRYFDPKLLRATDSNSIPRNRSPFQEAMVFVVGGGNYIEYQNLVEYCKGKAGGANAKRVIYGCTELLNASQFLKQLEKLGLES